MSDNSLALGIVVSAVVLLSVALWQLAATYRAKADVARAQAYRELAEANQASQDRSAAELAELSKRIGVIEQLLRALD